MATPSFRFTQNKFPKFDLSILNMPGTQNVPLGDFNIENNKVPCDCSLIKVTQHNKPKGLKVAKEDQRSIGLMVDRLDGRWSIGSYQISYAVK